MRKKLNITATPQDWRDLCEFYGLPTEKALEPKTQAEIVRRMKADLRSGASTLSCWSEYVRLKRMRLGVPIRLPCCHNGWK